MSTTKEAMNTEAEEKLKETETPLSLSINPNYLKWLKDTSVLGYVRPLANRVPSSRYYTVNVVAFRDSISTTLHRYLEFRFLELGRLTDAEIDEELKFVVPITVDACMAALYARIHSIDNPTNDRYNLSEEMKIPLPFADAIQRFGPFTTQSMAHNYKMIPTFKENSVDHAAVFDRHKYESAMAILGELGIPLRGVENRGQDGCAWWTYRPREIHGTIDLECVLPFLHYSGHSAMLALMFVSRKRDGSLQWIVDHHEDDLNYGLRMREVWDGSQLCVFSGLCHRPVEEWSWIANIR